MFEFTFKDIPENGSFAGKTIVLPTPTGDKETVIDALPPDFEILSDEHGIDLPPSQEK
jgi:hypothetical protein